MTNRERLSATVEADVLAAGRIEVAQGRAENLSAWVNDALRRQVTHDQRMRALDDFLDRLAHDGDDILTSDPQDLRALAQAAGRHVELIAV